MCKKTANFSNLYQARSQTMPIGGGDKNFTGAVVTSHRTQLTLQSLTPVPLL